MQQVFDLTESLLKEYGVSEDVIITGSAFFLDRGSQANQSAFFFSLYDEWLKRQPDGFQLPYAVKFLKPSLARTLGKIDEIFREFHEDESRRTQSLDQCGFGEDDLETFSISPSLSQEDPDS